MIVFVSLSLASVIQPVYAPPPYTSELTVLTVSQATTGPSSAVVTYSVEGKRDGTVITLSPSACSPQSGTTFNSIDTTVTCSFQDGSGTLISLSFKIRIDTTLPTTTTPAISPNPTGVAPTVTSTATDSGTATSTIAAAEFFIDTVGTNGAGIAMTAFDGSFNSNSEGLTASIPSGTFNGLSAGTHTIYVHAKDGVGNWGSTMSATFVKDTTAPTVSGVSSTAADGAYGVGALIPITVTFNEPVTVTGTPQIQLETGAIDRQVSYTSGSETATLTFNYVVQAGDISADLSYFATTSLTGTIKDAATNNAILTLPTPGAANSLSFIKNILIDTNSPTVVSIVVNKPVIKQSDVGTNAFQVTVTFSEAMKNTVTPTITFIPAAGVTTAPITLSTGTGSGFSLGDTVYTAVYDIVDNNAQVADVDVQVTNAQDKAGNVQTSMTNADLIDIDTAVPAAPVNNVPVASAFVNTAAPTISGTAEAGSTVTVTEGVTTLGTAVATAGSWSLTSASLIDGPHTITATATDTAGNISPATAPRSFTVDTVAPATTSPVVTPNLTNVGPTITATSTDAAPSSNISQAEYFIDTVGAAGTGIAMSASDGSFNGATEGLTATVPAVTFNALSQGTHTIYIHAKDGAGNWETTASSTFVKDTMAPATTSPVIAPSPTSVPPTITASATDSGTATSGIVGAEYFIDAVGTNGAGIAMTASDGSFESNTEGLTAILSAATFNALSQGSHTIYVHAKDGVGNWGTTTSSTFVKDTVAPTVNASPTGGLFNTAQSVALTPSEAAIIYYTTDDTEPTISSPTYTTPIAVSTTTTLKYFAKDTAGNSGTIQSQTYTIDTIAPTASASPTSGTFSSSQSVILTSNEPGAVIYYTNDGSEPDLSSPVYTTEIQVTGTTTIKFYARDTAGNLGSIVTENYVIDTDAPTVTATPLGGSYNTAQSVTLTASEPATIYYTTNGDTPTTSSTIYSSEISITTSTSLKFFAVDGLGNAGNVFTEVYTIDTTAPIVTATPTGGTYASSQLVTLTTNEPSTIYYTTNGATPTEASSTYSTAISITTTTTLKYFAKDTAGNSGTVVTQNYVIDSSVPVVTASPTGGTFGQAGTSVTLGANEPATIYYTTDGSTPTQLSSTYSSPITITSTTTLKFFAIDSIGNAGTVSTEVYTIDTTPPTVTASPIGALYNTAQSIILSANEQATIYYTMDGSTPTEGSSQYSSAIPISTTTTLKYFGKDVYGNSGTIQSQTYTIDTTPPTVTASPTGGTFSSSQSVTLGANEPATIYYTTNGATPTEGSSQYSSAITISTTTTLKYFAKDTAGNSGTVVTQNYVIDSDAPTVTATPPGGSYNTAQSVTLTANEPSTIYYTTNGDTPTTASSVYSSAISITSTTTLKFFAADSLGNSGNVQTEQYNIDIVAPTVNASPIGGSFNSAQSVTLTSSETATIYYTTDGATPTEASATYSSPIPIPSTTTLKFFGKDAAGNSGTVVTEQYVIDTTPPTVTASPTGATFGPSGTSVSLTANEPSTIYYTINGDTPTEASPTYSTAISITTTTTLKYFAKDTAGNSGTVQTHIYTIDNVPPTVSATPAGGTYTSSQSVTLSSNEPGTVIRYTTDGSEPTGTSPTYASPIGIAVDATLKFYGIDSYGNTGTIVTEVYDINVPDQPPGIIMQTGTTTGQSVWSGRPVHAEFVGPSSSLVGKHFDSMTLWLKKVGSTPPGTAQVGIINTDLSMKKVFATITPSTLPTGYTGIKYSLPEGDYYTIQAGDRIGIKYTAGTSSTYIAIQRDTNGSFNGANSYHTTYTSGWNTYTSVDLTMILEYSGSGGSTNTAPVANAGPDQSVTEDTLVTLTGLASTDSDGSIASYSWIQTSGPAVTLSSPSASQPTFTAPSVSSTTVLTFSLTVTDNQGLADSTPDTVQITVNDSGVPNTPPVANAGPDQTVNEGTLVTLDGTGSTDSDGSVTSYTWSQTSGPAVTLSSNTASQPTFTAPSVGAAGATLVFSLGVTDNLGASDATSDSVTVTVNNVNQPPVANAGPDQTVTEGALVTLTGLGSTDSDGTIASYSWSQASGPAVTLSSATASQPTFTAPPVDAATILTFSLTVTDNQGLADPTPDTVQVTVNDATAQPPGIIMQTGPTTGQSVWSGRPVHAEFVGPSSSLVGKHIDSITLWLKKVGSTPPGTAEVGIINTDLSMKKVFATITPSTLHPTSYTSAEYALPAGDYYTIQAGDRIGIKYTAGTSSTYIAIQRDTTGSFDGANSYHTTYTSGWNPFTSVDLAMILEYNGGTGGGSSDTTPPTVSASPAGGTYTSSQSVELTANEPATIYYTTDGSTPNDTSSPEYPGPISVTTDSTLKFYAIDTAGNPSSVVTEVYDIETGGGGGTGQEPGIVMEDTSTSTGWGIYSGRPVMSEYASGTSVLVGKYIDSITVVLKKTGTPTGTAEVGIINTDLSIKKLFATIDVTTLATGYTAYTFNLPSGDNYLIEASDRIGVKYTGGSSSTENNIAIQRDTTASDPFDGANTYLSYYTTSWTPETANDLTMTLTLID